MLNPLSSPIADGAQLVRSTIMMRSSLVLGLLLLIAVTLVFPFPMKGRLWGSLFDLAHAPVFCGAMLGCVGIADPAAIGLSSKWTVVLSMTFRRILWAGGILITLGVLCEYLQKFAGRSPSLGDIAANSAGILAALIWIVSRRQPRLVRGLMAATSVGVLIAISMPTAAQIRDSYLQIRSFPLLASFERRHELDGWTARHATATRFDSWATHGNHSLQLTLHPAKYSGISLPWFEADWRAYQTLAMDIRNPNSEPLTLIVKLFDRQHAESVFDHHDRFHQTILVAADSERNVAINLADVEAAPADRKMDLSNMAVMDVFAIDVTSDRSCLIDNIRLVR